MMLVAFRLNIRLCELYQEKKTSQGKENLNVDVLV